MKEKLLHFIWRFQLFGNSPLKTTDGKTIEILNRGNWNKIDSGPDFSMAQIRINQKTWAGSIEIHVASSDWETHKHSSDEAYNNVVLHVVYEHNKEIPTLKKRNVPTLELKSFIPDEVLRNYQNLTESHESFIPCEKSIHLIRKEKLKFWLDRLVIERLERKTEEIEKELIENNKNWEQLLFKKLAYAFGLKINAETFSLWANSFDFKVLTKIQHNPDYVQALFFGQAGFLQKNSQDNYIQELQKNYTFLQSKYHLQALNSSIFKFFRLRPVSFPTIRLMQLASVYSHYQNLFSFLMGTQKVQRIFPVFHDLKYPDFWETHFTLDKESKIKSTKNITQSMVERLIINVIIPIKFVYSKSHTNTDVSEQLIDWLLELPAEKNSVIDGFSKLGLKAKNAFESQAFLELKKHFCNEKKCLNCAIGLQILKNV
ncbi:MAG: DUF2851 family protein [Weeksellaceae bacterium]|jgi:hypothetical protein|nr:DUF2851 family protein [Weeksellaceae bacterium]MDX9705248.1 DUF2851 family protein [Weeksellaceae bacterium]